jgi:SAM-dependent methyltransferase
MMTAARHCANLGVYNAPDVVTHYAGLDYLTPAEQLLFETHIKPGTFVLDLGVGGGRTTPYLSKIASTYVGMDYSEEMIRACRTKFPKLQFKVQDAADLSMFADESFDSIVFSFNGIDYLVPSEKRQRCLHECYRVLKRGGTFIFSCHNPRSIVLGWDWDWNGLRMKTQKVAADGGKLYFEVVLAGLSCAKFGLAMCRASFQSVPRAFRRLRTNLYWRGEGYSFDPSHGGLWTHQATPHRVIKELSNLQFKFLQVLPEDHPRKPRSWRTRWYYYAFSKPS